MKKNICLSLLAIASAVLFPAPASAQFPKPAYGFNLGNTLEPPTGEGTWGPKATKALLDSFAKAGFNVARIPCAWDCHSDKTTYQIDPTYTARVKEVVGWCRARGFFVILNDHWDGGWLENHIGDKPDPVIDAKMRAYWTQIANAFIGYDDHLAFAGANEPNVTTAAQMATLSTYYQTFVDAVRATGGKNTSRWLVVQGPNTDIDATDKLMNSLPKDKTTGRLMVEVHFYAPFQFTIMSSDASWGKMFYFWGKGYHAADMPERNATWGEEPFVESEFQKMEAKFTSKGIPVIVGEFGAGNHGDKADLKGDDVALATASTSYYTKTVVDASHRHGLTPCYWSTPGSVFDWTTGQPTNPAIVQVLTGGPALSPNKAAIPVSGAQANNTVVGAVKSASTGNP